MRTPVTCATCPDSTRKGCTIFCDDMLGVLAEYGILPENRGKLPGEYIISARIADSQYPERVDMTKRSLIIQMHFTDHRSVKDISPLVGSHPQYVYRVIADETKRRKKEGAA